MKLNTEHLKTEIERILNEDGISQEELAIRSGIHRTTIYSILSNRNPSTQRAIGRKIAEGTNREFKIIGDKIYFSKPDPEIDEFFSEEDKAWGKLSADTKRQLIEVAKAFIKLNKSQTINKEKEN